MTRASIVRLSRLAVAALLAAGGAGCGGTSPAPEARAASRPVRIASHETEADAPEAPSEYQAEGASIAVTPEADGDGPRAEPPPVEPPAFH